MLDIKSLLAVADGFMEATGIEREVTLSHRIFGDSKRLTDLRAGGELTVGRFNMAMTWLSDRWPADREVPPALVLFRRGAETQDEAAA